MKNKIIISRPINGITINGLEYILDDDGDVMELEYTPCIVITEGAQIGTVGYDYDCEVE